MEDSGTDYSCNMKERELIQFSSVIISLFVSIPAWCLAAIYIPEIIVVVFVLCILAYYVLVSFKHKMTSLPILFVITSLVTLVILTGIFSYYAVHPVKGVFCEHPKDNRDGSHGLDSDSRKQFQGRQDDQQNDDDCGRKSKYITFICIFLAYGVVNVFALCFLCHLQFLLQKIKKRNDLEAAESKRPPLPTYEAALEAHTSQPKPIYAITPLDLMDDFDLRKKNAADNSACSRPPPTYSNRPNMGVIIPFPPPFSGAATL